jgi:RHS repeat-associated protein
LSQSQQGTGGVGGLIAAVNGSLTTHYCYDANGNVTQVIDTADDSLAAHYEYDPFGNEVAAVGPMAGENVYRFSTKYLDAEVNLYYYGYRYYSPELGRWINRDPIGEEGGLNLYIVIGNSPLNGIDRYGLDYEFGYGSKQGIQNMSDAMSSTRCKGCNRSSSGPSEMDQKVMAFGQGVIEYFTDLGVKIKTIVEVGYKGMEAQARINRELGLAWDGNSSDMFKAYELIQRRAQYSALRYRGFKHNRDSWNCIGACAIVAVIGEDNGYPLDGAIHTWGFKKLGDIALDKAEKKGLQTITVRFGSKFLPIIGAVSTADTIINFLYCNVQCQYCGNSEGR